MFEALFQTFDDPVGTEALPQRLAALREELVRRGLTGFIVPRADQHQNEYVPPSEERLAWLTGFTGSAGFAVVLRDRAVLFVDGRYTLQATHQVDATAFTVASLTEPPPETWLADNLAADDRIGFDPWLSTTATMSKLSRICGKTGAAFVALDDNPIDVIWHDRPAPPQGAVFVHDLRFAGEAVADKIARIVAELPKFDLDALVVSDPHAVAWAFNIRGADVAHTPLPLAYALIEREGCPTVFVDPRKLTETSRHHLAQNSHVAGPDLLVPTLAALAEAGATIGLDAATAADALTRLIETAGGKAKQVSDPVAALKAIKNATEIAGSRIAHARDGAALARFLAFIDQEAPSGRLTEIDVVEALETFRRKEGGLRDISFPTIAGAGANGAIVHYRVTRLSNRRIAPDTLLLIDSGGQYEDGTTDVTRTVAVGAPSDEMRDRFTRVLKGHIAIARAIFPDGANGAQLDSFARQHLWQAGLDYAHGTGHGVGSFLSVHEGPARISKLGTVPLQRGMILSNEPGYYKTGHYGIRIENLVLVREAAIDAAEQPMNAFETLTLAPIDRRLIVSALMGPEDIAWLDSYHARVVATLSPLVDATTRAWLEAACAPIE